MKRALLFLVFPTVSVNKENKKLTVKLFNMKTFNGIAALLVSVCTAMIGYTIHHSLFWAFVDFFFWPIAWIKWLVCQEVNMTIIRQTFEFLGK